MQHLAVNFGGIWSAELAVFIRFFPICLLKKSGLIFKSPVATLLPTPQRAYAMVDTHIVQCHYLSILIRFHVMQPNTSVSSVNKHC